MSDLIILNPLSALLSDPEVCDRYLWRMIEEENEALEALEERITGPGVIGIIVESLLRGLTTDLGTTLAGLVPPAMTDYARRGPRSVREICTPTPGTAALINQRRRLGHSAQRAMEHFGFRVSQVQQMIVALIEVAGFVGGLIQPASRMAATSTRSITQIRAASGPLSPGRSAPFQIVELGAGDLEASIRMQRRSSVRVTAIDPFRPNSDAIERLQAIGGRFQSGTAADVASESADHVVSYFPFPIEGQGGRFVRMSENGVSYTGNLVSHGLRALRRGGVLTIVTESEETARHFARSATRAGMRASLSHPVPAIQAAPGATGSGVPNFSADSSVFLIHIYKQ